MKKILILLLCTIFLVGTVSAFNWDNKLSYSNEDLKVDFDNLFGFGKHYGSAELKSHPSVNYIKKVGAGNPVTMWYDFDFKDLYKNGLGEVIFTDQRTGEEIERDYSFVYLGEKERDVMGKGKCNVAINGTEFCDSIIVGTETYGVWLPYDSKDIPKGKVRIGLRVEVKVGDYVDGIWEIVGKKVKKHAFWTEDLNLNLVSCFKLNESAGVWAEDSFGENNGTYGGSLPTPVSALLSIAQNYTTNTDEVDVPNVLDFWTNTNVPFAINMWINSEEANRFQRMIDAQSGELMFQKFGTGQGCDNCLRAFSVGVFDSLSQIAIPLNQDIMITASSDGTTISMYFNDTIVNTTAVGSTARNITTTLIGKRIGNTAETFKGLIGQTLFFNDSVSGAQVTQMFNNGIGINCTDSVPILIVTLNSPIDTFNTTNPIISFNGTISSENTLANVSLIIDGIYNETNSSGINNTDYIFTKTFSDGDGNWTYEGCDDVSCTNATVRTFTIDTTAPIINISDPIDATNYIYLINNETFNLNVTVTDINLDTCFYEYNSTNTTYSCSTGVQQNETFNIINQSDILVWANDTSGTLNNSQVSWTFDLFDFNNYTYDLNITELSQTTIIGDFQTGSSISSAYLEYNNTNYSASINSLGGNIYILSRTVTSPTVATDINISWNFWVNNINSTLFNQTILNVNLDNCSSYNFTIVYYYLEDELDQTLISNENSTIESLVNLKTIIGEDVAQFNQVFEGNSTPQVCSEINLTNSNLRIWEQSRYGSDDYVFEQHNTQNASMSIPANFTLLDLPSTSATTFRIVYKSETFLPVTDAVIDVQRKYIGEGVFKTVESPITDANGEVSASLDLDSVIYRIIVRQNGITLSTFENPAVACQNILTGDCTININERQTINLINNYDTINDFNYGLTQDNRTITLTFEIPSGTSKSVNLFVNQSTILGNKTSCNQTAFATSGQVQCVIDPTLGDVFANVDVSSDGTLITTASTTIIEDRSQYFGTDNIVLTFFLVLSLVLLMVSDPIAVLIGIVIGLIAGGLMLFLNVGSLFGVTSILMYLIIIVIILIVKISNRQR